MINIFDQSLLPALQQDELFNKVTTSQNNKKLLIILMLHTSQIKFIKSLTNEYNEYLMRECAEFTKMYTELCEKFESEP